MKQKYVVLLDENTEKLAIQEYAELDKEMLSLLCEETYETYAIKDAMGRDRNALIQALRTHNMYPPGAYTERIADAVVEVFQSDGNTSAELFFEEKDLFEIQETVKSSAEASEDEDEDDVGVDELLDDDISSDYEEKGLLKNLKKTIKTSDEDTSIDDN